MIFNLLTLMWFRHITTYLSSDQFNENFSYFCFNLNIRYQSYYSSKATISYPIRHMSVVKCRRLITFFFSREICDLTFIELRINKLLVNILNNFNKNLKCFIYGTDLEIMKSFNNLQHLHFSFILL